MGPQKASLLFCCGSIGVFLLIAAAAFPFAAMSKDQITAANSVVSAEQLGVMDLGSFGQVPVTELVSYYMENPPEPAAAAGAPKKIRFEGC